MSSDFIFYEPDCITSGIGVASHTSTYGVYTNMIDLSEKEMLLSHTFKNSFGDVRLVDRH
jgi:hypothetical protein